MFHKSGFCQGVLAVILAAALVSCSPRVGLAERRAHATTASAREQKKSVKEKDSVRVEVRFFQVRDTFFRDSIVFRWRTKIVHDTVLQIDSFYQCDTLRVVEYVNSESWFDKVTDKIGGVSLLLIVLVFIIQILKTKRHD